MKNFKGEYYKATTEVIEEIKTTILKAKMPKIKEELNKTEKTEYEELQLATWRKTMEEMDKELLKILKKYENWEKYSKIYDETEKKIKTYWS